MLEIDLRRRSDIGELHFGTSCGGHHREDKPGRYHPVADLWRSLHDLSKPPAGEYSLVFLQNKNLICREIREALLQAGRPSELNGVRLGGAAQTKVKAQVIL